MKTIGLFNNKGGSGKTATAVALACRLRETGATVALLDIDPQATASFWGDNAEVVDGDGFAVLSVVAARLERTLAALAEGGVDYALIDTAAKSEADARIAAELCDLLLVVCRPTAADIHGARNTVSLLDVARKRGSALFMFNAVKHPSHLEGALKGVADTYGIPAVPHHFGDYAVFQHAFRDGLSVGQAERHGRAAEQIVELTDWVVARLKKGGRK